MTWYDVDLKEAGVEQLNGLFSKDPFSTLVKRAERYTYGSVYFYMEGEKKAFMTYDSGKILVYHGVTRTFPETVREQIHQVLGQIKPLERILEEIIRNNSR